MTSTEEARETQNERGVRPRQTAPNLVVQLTDGTSWILADARPRSFTMIVFYRGHHCPVCRAQLSELNRRLDELVERGVDVVAISGDTEEVAAKTVDEWRLDRLTV